jgi:hypothetical protein
MFIKYVALPWVLQSEKQAYSKHYTKIVYTNINFVIKINFESLDIFKGSFLQFPKKQFE